MFDPEEDPIGEYIRIKGVHFKVVGIFDTRQKGEYAIYDVQTIYIPNTAMQHVFNLRKQEMESAENNLELVREGASKKSGTVSNLVTATVNGMLLEVPVKEGSFVIESNTFNDGTTIATIANMSDMIFEGSVDETEIGKLNLGMELNLKIGALGERNFYANTSPYSIGIFPGINYYH